MLPRLPPTGTQGERCSRTSSSPPTSRPNSWSNPPTRRRSVRRRPLRPRVRHHDRTAAPPLIALRPAKIPSPQQASTTCCVRCPTAATPLPPPSTHEPTYTHPRRLSGNPIAKIQTLIRDSHARLTQDVELLMNKQARSRTLAPARCPRLGPPLRTSEPRLVLFGPCAGE